MSYDLAVFIGRFQPYHLGHHSVVREALTQSKHLLICVGSSGQPRDTYNPFTFEERRDMILLSIPPQDRNRVLVLPLLDYTYNDEKWVIDVQDAAVEACEHFRLSDPSIALIGHSKDHTSFYLKLFPQWSSVNVAAFIDEKFVLSATMLRETYFGNGASQEVMIPSPVADFLNQFKDTKEFRHIVEEFKFIQDYKDQFAGLPYPPIFVTVDACVVQSGHVLLVQRRSRPGKGFWALPGGFLNANERIEDAVYRELREETKIKVPEPVLRGSTLTSRVFDHVHRSARGRTITHAFLIHLKPDLDLPKVKGSDDAQKAVWVPLAKVDRSMMFEDHFAIITALTGLL
jgi:bifunctional NMN adenylyltransferase/nudix hydrolase